MIEQQPSHNMLRCEIMRYVYYTNTQNIPLKGFRTFTGTGSGTVQYRIMSCWQHVIKHCLKLELHVQH